MKTCALSFATLGALFLLGGCGSGGGGMPPVKPAAPDTGLLAGNWLLTASMPSYAVIAGQPTDFRLAVTFDVAGNVISATGFGNDMCSNGGHLSFGLLTSAGTVAADGSFTIETPANVPSLRVTIQGSVPHTAGAPWSGTYSTAISTPLGQGCQASSSGSFTATYFPLLKGTYSGSVTGAAFVGSPPTPAPQSIEVSLQQGGDAASSVTAFRMPRSSILTGSIRVQGSSCFNSGTTDGTDFSNIEGNEIQLTFAMDDGSTLRLVGSLDDVSESRIMTTIATVTGGRCGATTPYGFLVKELDRQN